MGRRVIFIALLSILTTAFAESAFACRTGKVFPFDSGEKTCPKDVQSFMDRVNDCEHFGAEEPYDAKRRKELSDIMEKSSCGRLWCDYDALLKKYDGTKYGKIMKNYVAYVDRQEYGDAEYANKYLKCKVAANKGS